MADLTKETAVKSLDGTIQPLGVEANLPTQTLPSRPVINGTVSSKSFHDKGHILTGKQEHCKPVIYSRNSCNEC